MEQEKHQIELMSEKIRNIMGEMPHSLTLWSNIVFITIVLCLIVAVAIYLIWL